MIYIQLFLSFLQIGLFSVGGGYAAIPLVQSLIVERQGWITMTEFTNLITIAEMTPGPIAVNSATFVGIRIAGLPGAVAATWGCIFPSCIIVSVLAYIYRRYRGGSAMGSILGSLLPSGSGADRRCRTFDATGSSSSRGKWGEDDPVGQSGSFFGSFYSAPQMETEPNSCDVGLRRCQPGS